MRITVSLLKDKGYIKAIKIEHHCFLFGHTVNKTQLCFYIFVIMQLQCMAKELL